MALIDRAAAIAYLKKHKQLGKEAQCILAADEDSIIRFLETKCPAVDAVPVVRCKDCKRFNKDINWCGCFGTCVNLDGYCNYGERRGEQA